MAVTGSSAHSGNFVAVVKQYCSCLLLLFHQNVVIASSRQLSSQEFSDFSHLCQNSMHRAQPCAPLLGLSLATKKAIKLMRLVGLKDCDAYRRLFAAQPHMFMLHTTLKKIDLGNCDVVIGRLTKAWAVA